MATTNWIERWMAPLYGRAMQQGMPEVIYAPDLDEAFTLARVRWPSAKGWRCLGRAEGENLIED